MGLRERSRAAQHGEADAPAGSGRPRGRCFSSTPCRGNRENLREDLEDVRRMAPRAKGLARPSARPGKPGAIGGAGAAHLGGVRAHERLGERLRRPGHHHEYPVGGREQLDAVVQLGPVDHQHLGRRRRQPLGQHLHHQERRLERDDPGGWLGVVRVQRLAGRRRLRRADRLQARRRGDRRGRAAVPEHQQRHGQRRDRRREGGLHRLAVAGRRPSR